MQSDGNSIVHDHVRPLDNGIHAMALNGTGNHISTTRNLAAHDFHCGRASNDLPTVSGQVTYKEWAAIKRHQVKMDEIELQRPVDTLEMHINPLTVEVMPSTMIAKPAEVIEVEAKVVARRELITYSWDRTADPVGLF